MAILSCSAPNCDAPVHVKKSGLCKSHYNHFRTYGDFELAKRASNCLFCGEKIIAKGHCQVLRKYCSQKCRDKASYERHREERREAARKNYVPKPKNLFVCEQCGSSFEAHSPRSKFCSHKCSVVWGDLHAGQCSVEGCERGVRARGWCSMHYRRWRREIGAEKPDPWSDRRRANYQKRRALKQGVDAEEFSSLKVFERDNWACGLCGEPVDSDLKWPDPRSASLDHIVPLSKGGPHTRNNTQCAHLSCNVSKGNQYDGGIREV